MEIFGTICDFWEGKIKKRKDKTVNIGMGHDLPDLRFGLWTLFWRRTWCTGCVLGRLERKSKWSPVLRGAIPYIARARA